MNLEDLEMDIDELIALVDTPLESKDPINEQKSVPSEGNCNSSDVKSSPTSESVFSDDVLVSLKEFQNLSLSSSFDFAKKLIIDGDVPEKFKAGLDFISNEIGISKFSNISLSTSATELTNILDEIKPKISDVIKKVMMAIE